MDSKQKRKAPVTIQADADHEVVTTPLFKLYQTNPPRKNRSSWRLLELEADWSWRRTGAGGGRITAECSAIELLKIA
jgi:hypothetical protein